MSDDISDIKVTEHVENRSDEPETHVPSSDHLVDLDNDPLRIINLERKIIIAIYNEDFATALEDLEDLLPLPQDPWRKIHAHLQAIACHARQDKHFEIVDTLSKLEDLLKQVKADPDYVIKEAERYVNENWSKAFALFYCACKLYLDLKNAQQGIDGITKCFKKIREHFAPLVKMDEFKKQAIYAHVIPKLVHLAREIKTIPSEKSLNSAAKARGYAWCCIEISSFYRVIGNEKKVRKELKKALKFLKEDGVKLCHVWGICQHNIGTSYLRLFSSQDCPEGEIKREKAMKYFKKATHSYHISKDLTEAQRDEELEKTAKGLRCLHELPRP